MIDTYVYCVKLPKGVSEMVTPGADNDYTVYINKDLPPDKQIAAYQHALRHVERNDFGMLNVQEIEEKAHEGRTT